jgi:hypothetical protein
MRYPCPRCKQILEIGSVKAHCLGRHGFTVARWRDFLLTVTSQNTANFLENRARQSEAKKTDRRTDLFAVTAPTQKRNEASKTTGKKHKGRRRKKKKKPNWDTGMRFIQGGLPGLGKRR